jgi:hypothetical protein
MVNVTEKANTRQAAGINRMRPPDRTWKHHKKPPKGNDILSQIQNTLKQLDGPQPRYTKRADNG